MSRCELFGQARQTGSMCTRDESSGRTDRYALGTKTIRTVQQHRAPPSPTIFRSHVLRCASLIYTPGKKPALCGCNLRLLSDCSGLRLLIPIRHSSSMCKGLCIKPVHEHSGMQTTIGHTHCEDGSEPHPVRPDFGIEIMPRASSMTLVQYV